MQQLEIGAIANPDENRMVGHYWLRNADLAPSEELTTAIRKTLAKVKEVANAVHSGSLKSHRVLLLICSSLVSAVLHWVHSLWAKHSGIRIPINYGYTSLTIPILTESIIPSPKSGFPSTTLALVISKSGGTPETRNGMLEAENAFTQKDWTFPSMRSL